MATLLRAYNEKLDNHNDAGVEKNRAGGAGVSHFEHGYCQTEIKGVKYLYSAFGFVLHLKRLEEGVIALVTMKIAFRLSTPGSKSQPVGHGSLQCQDILNPNVLLHN
jgi:hypothetical protein